MTKLRLIRNPNLTDTPIVIKLPESVELVAGQIDETEEDRQAQVLRTDDLVKDLARQWAEAVVDLRDPKNRERFQKVKKQMQQVELMGLGFSETMPLFAHPSSAALVIPAIDSFLRVVPILQKDFPFTIKDVELEDVRRDRDNLVFLRQLQTEGSIHRHGLECVITGLEQSLANRAYTIWERLGKAPELHYVLGLELKDLKELASNNATQAQETKKQVAKVVKQLKDQGVVRPTPQAPEPAEELAEDEAPKPSPSLPRPRSTPRK